MCERENQFIEKIESKKQNTNALDLDVDVQFVF